MLGFWQVLKPIKRQDLLEKGKKGHNAFRTGAKIHFSENKYFGVRGTLREQLLCFSFFVGIHALNRPLSKIT